MKIKPHKCHKSIGQSCNILCEPVLEIFVGKSYKNDLIINASLEEIPFLSINGSN